ncbi:MAG: MotA/TolQ/ExbB proton channel family protein [Methyloligellaceae bacterium]
MDIATIAGIVAGAVIVGIAILMGGDPGTFINVPSILIVIGGGFAATVIRFPLANVFSALILGAKVAFTHKKTSPKEMIDEITVLAEIIRKEGPLGLENAEIKEVLLQKGSQMVADGYDLEVIRANLERERDLYIERLDEGARIYKSLGDAAPAFGMIGTLVGLVQMLSTMDDPSTIGPSMAVALLTTLYGAVLANLVALPIADKLNNKMSLEELNQTLALDGIVQLRENKSPQLIQESLIAYLPEKQRASVLAEGTA